MLTISTTTSKPLATDTSIQQLVRVLEKAKDSTGTPITTEEIPIITDQILDWLLKHPDLEARIQECLDDIRFKVR
ncbi:hypothetical protein JOY44_26215 (plasmid) [Phormidium sp. CLA17]|uniref:hypothetical protein n=1 Tax=Leptolyngbya sp. Cla-17 TaxID=2803751 RepID=UPI0014908C8B|nr:hypothetical protein [Leptolyngbya sp. Cla-17]MBM0745018.1 hypothetical protein [Leptolyngbya sp. Cla-17]